MRKITKLMINIWKMENIDWLGYVLEKDDYFSFHHIKKKQDGGKIKIDNGAILCGKSSHPYIHLIESRDIEMYVYLNNLLKNINSQRTMPNKQQLLAINSILKQFEREHCSDKNKYGELLIKEKYVRRLIK